MNRRYFGVVLLTIVFIVSLGNAAWAEKEKSSIFSITSAMSFAWYPYSTFTENNTFSEEGGSTNGVSDMDELS